MKKYRMLEVIGDGTYGTVWKGITIDTGETVAIKKLKSKIKSWQECVDMNEVRVLSKLKSHDNIIKLKEITRESNSEVFFIFEYADSNLYEYIESFRKKGKSIPENKIRQIFLQIANGLNYIHSNGYFHRDLKPENILMMNDTFTMKIADFGLAKEVPTYYTGVPLTDYVCTRWYRAPECILKSTNYSSAMDIWALGCILAEMYLLNPLFPGTSEFDQLSKVVDVIGTPKFNDWPEGYKLIQKLGMKFPPSSGVHLSSLLPEASMEGINLLYDIFNWEAFKRPSCAKILTHAYFNDSRPSTNSTNKNYNGFGRYVFNNSMNTNNGLTNRSKASYNTEQYNSSVNSNSNLSNLNNAVIKVSEIGSDDYETNFNYNTYKNHKGMIPDTNMNIGFSNQNNYEKKSKLSTLAENEIRQFNLMSNMLGNGNGNGRLNYGGAYPYNYFDYNQYNQSGSNMNTNNGYLYQNQKPYHSKVDLENQFMNVGLISKPNLYNYSQLFI